jgi:hypothetical protein
VVGYSEAARLVRGGHQAEQQLRTKIVEGSEAEFVDEDGVVA